MLQRFKTLAVAGSLLFAAAACDKDEDQVVLNNTSTPTLTASATTADISSTTGSNQAVTYTWQPANFDYQAAITYTLQFAKSGTNFASTVDFNMGTALTKSFTVAELNTLYNDVDCELPATPTPFMLDVRVKASVGDAAPASMSTVKTLMASPYPAVVVPNESWGLVGPAGDGWPGATPTDRVMTYDCRERGFVLRTTLSKDKFKFRRDKDWGVNLGGSTGNYANGVDLTLGGADLDAEAGTYTIVLKITRDAAGKPTAGRVIFKP